MKAVVIGAGPGGLGTALRLAAKGWEVTVFEAGPSPGGKMNWLRSGDYGFDTGPSLITMPDVFAELFAAAGEDIHGHVSLVRLDPHAEYRFADGSSLLCPAGLEAWRNSIRMIEPADVSGFDRIHALGRKLYELSARTFFRRSPYSRPDLSELAALRYMPGPRAWGNYASAVEHFFRSPYLRQIYNRYPTYVGSSPYLCPATLLIIPFLEREFGAWYVRGGLYRMIEALIRVLESQRVCIQTNARVASIEHDSMRVAGVVLQDGTRHKADVVVMNGDVATAERLTGGTDATPEKNADMRSLSGFVILAGVKKRPAGLAHHSVLFSRDYRAEFDDLFKARRFPLEPTVYINAPAATDPSVAPAGADAIFIMTNAPADGENWHESDTCAASKRVLEIVARSGLKLELDGPMEVWDPGRFARDYLAPGGAIYGTHSHGWKRAFYRPPNRSPKVKGLYFVGGSTHPGGGTPTVLMSARIVSGMIEADARA